MNTLLIENCRLYDAPDTDPTVAVFIHGGVIERVGGEKPPAWAGQLLDAQGRILAPGFIDVHIQGAGGADVLDATPEALQTISRTCARFGVTGFLATTVHKPKQENHHLSVAAECVGRDLGGARLLGVHLEGPFISTDKKGMIQPDCIGPATEETLDDILAELDGSLKMMTLAPELPGCDRIVRSLVTSGAVPALGHSNATYQEAVRGFEQGIRHVTHLFNAMPSLHHRAPGPLAAIFERPEVSCQVITDGVHIHPSVVRLTYQALGPGRLITITDAMQAMGLPDGHYTYNDIKYESKGGAARYADGTLIGTALGLNQVLARLIQFTHCPLPAAVRTVTENAADILSLGQTKGRIAPGFDADLVLLDRDLSACATIVAGHIVYKRPGEGDR